MDLTFNTQGRVFVNTNPKDNFKFYNNMAVGAIETTLPAKEDIFTFDSRNKAIKIAENIDHIGEVTSALSGYVPFNAATSLEKIIRQRRVNLQVHFGRCTNPANFDEFQSAIILKGVTLKTHGLSEPTTITTGKALVQESATISIEDSYRIYLPNFVNAYQNEDEHFFGIDFASVNDCDLLYQSDDVIIAGYNNVAMIKLL